MDEKYTELRKQLSSLGYTQSFPFESMELIGNIFGDLIQTTRSLRYYVNLSKELVEERDSFKSAAEPYKCDNAKLVRDNNKLHMELMHCKEDLVSKVRDTKSRVKELQDKINQLVDQNRTLKIEIQEYRLKSITGKTASSTNKIKDPSRILSKSESDFNSIKSCSTCLEVKNQMDKQTQEIVNLNNKIAMLKTQLSDRNDEIKRLSLQLEGGRPLSVLKQEYNFGHQNGDTIKLITKLDKRESEITNLNEQLKDLLMKQHEAMKRAVQLDNSNKLLNRKLRDTEQMALQLEADCNSKLKDKQNLITSLKSQIASFGIERCDDELKNIMVSQEGFLAKLEAKINENNVLVSSLASVTALKDSLLEDNRALVKHCRELEETLSSLKSAYKIDKNISEDILKLSTNTDNIPKEFLKLLERERSFYERHLNDIKEKLNNYEKLDPFAVNKEEFDKIKQERDFYFKQYNDLKGGIPREEYVKELQNKLCNLEHQIFILEKQNKISDDKNIALQTELTVSQSSARSKLYAESERFKYYENDIKAKQITELRSECNNLRENLKISEGELLHMKTIYNQLKALQHENDKSMSDVHAQMFEARKEIGELKTSLLKIQQQKHDIECELKILKSEKTVLKDNLGQIDKERDKLVMDVDEKTEKMFTLQHQLRSKDTTIELLENKVTELNRKLELVSNENTLLEHKLRDVQTGSEAYSFELDAITKQRDNAVIENRRLQSDMAALTNDLRSIKREYENSRKEVDEMKQQLQHYVDEVRRIEDILSRKEAERTEMLDHFASLSQEATVLETNNHSLESETASKSVLLQSANHRLIELETKLKSRESLVGMQEEKISSMALKISLLEDELGKHHDLLKHSEKMLNHERELCKILDNQKKSILAGVGESESEKKNLEHDLKVIHADKEMLEDKLSKARSNLESIEILLSECRRENVELKLSVQNFSDENQKLVKKVDNLLRRLSDIENENLTGRQRAEEAAKYLQDLQHQMTDERYQRVMSSSLDKKLNKSHGTGTL